MGTSPKASKIADISWLDVVSRLHEPFVEGSTYAPQGGGVLHFHLILFDRKRVRTIPAAFRNMQCRRNLGKNFFCVGTSPCFG